MGRGFMKATGVFGGSMFGITFFQASTKDESALSETGRSVEKGRALELAEERMGRAKRPVARRNMVEGESWDRSALAGSERERERERERKGVWLGWYQWKWRWDCFVGHRECEYFCWTSVSLVGLGSLVDEDVGHSLLRVNSWGVHGLDGLGFGYFSSHFTFLG